MIQTVIAVNVLVRKPPLGRVAQTIEPVCVLPRKNVTLCPDTGWESNSYRLDARDDHQSLQTAS